MNPILSNQSQLDLMRTILVWVALFGWWFLPVFASMHHNDWWQDGFWPRYIAYFLGVWALQIGISFLIGMIVGIYTTLAREESLVGLYRIFTLFYLLQLLVLIPVYQRMMRRSA